MNCFCSLRPVVVFAAAIGVLALSARASAEERAYRAHGAAHFISPTDFVGSGEATHLGRYTEVGSVAFSPTDDPTVLRIDAWSIYTAANGDQLYAIFTGRLNGLTGQIIATGTYVGGTGRFKDADGSSALAGQLLPDGTIAVSVQGAIDY